MSSPSLVYPNEPKLFKIAWAFSALCWTLLIVGTVGIGLVYLALGGLVYLFVQSGLITYLKGTAVKVGADQLPDLHGRMKECCDRLGVGEEPEVYVLNGQGLLNALACRFLRRYYVVLFSNVVDALAEHPAALDFYLGHELGHIQRGHVRRHAFLAPARVLPLLGAAYARAREYTCDLHGLACCDDPKDAAYALAVLAAGERSWSQINLNRYAEQSRESGGFWMSFHELTADYPWLSKRMKYLLSTAGGKTPDFPRRHPAAFGLAFFIPGVGGGSAAGLGSLMTMVAIIGMLAAIAIPNFLRFQLKSTVRGVKAARLQIEAATAGYIDRTGYLPNTLADTGLPEPFVTKQIAGVTIGDADLTIQLAPELAEGVGGSTVTLTPYLDSGELRWRCGGDLQQVFLDQVCADGARPTAAAAAGDAGASGARLQVGEDTCSDAFHDTAQYAQLDEATRSSLRQACNTWKLQQVANGL